MPRLLKKLTFNHQIYDVLNGEFPTDADRRRILSLGNLVVMTYQRGIKSPDPDYDTSHVMQYIYNPPWAQGVTSDVTTVVDGPLSRFSGVALTHNSEARLYVSDLPEEDSDRRKLMISGNQTNDLDVESYSLITNLDVASARDRIKELVQLFFNEAASSNLERQ